MSIAKAEELKKQLTDKYVVVKEGVPELRRFAGLTGTVKTVNMNNRALVQFDGPADIAWYDIDPGYLTVVNAPLAKKKREGHPAEGGEKKPPAVAKPVAAKPASSGKSPLELAREQAAAKGSTPAATGGEKKLSPLEMARKQGAAKPADTAPAVVPAEAGEKKLSPLELARMQGAAKSAVPKAEVPAPAATPNVSTAPAPAPEATPAAVSKAAVSKAAVEKPGSTAEILALVRRQGPYKG